MSFTLTINTNGSAFRHVTNDEDSGEPNPGPEVARLLRKAADKIDAGYIGLTGLMDVNGNTVGHYDFTKD